MSTRNGRCDALTGICAAGLPDKVVNDARPTTSSWKAARKQVAVGFGRMCRACQGGASFNHLHLRCWSEFLYAIHGCGMRNPRCSRGERKTYEGNVRQRDSVDQVRCDGEIADAPAGYNLEHLPF
mmetsp:Transcript_35343/g.59642  ORF Transcript_35343/g.59642 Transcript_35343/m.59642 type:complete len:125 (-) Transcript_35343:37-411(-)